MPVHDELRTRRFPWMNLTLIAVNLLIFVYELDGGAPLVRSLAMYPQAVLHPSAWLAQGGWPLITLVTSQFLHASWMHVVGNMLFLYVFGDNIEDLLGHWRYLLFYILGGIIAGVAQAFSDPLASAATIGASGAVAAVLGAYVVNYPRIKVITLIPALFYIPLRLPAWLVLGFWFAVQLFGGLTPLDALHYQSGVAFWAHISGFVGGAGLVGLLQTKPRVRVGRGDEGADAG